MTASHYAPDTLARPGQWLTLAVCARPGVDKAWWYSDKVDEQQLARRWCRHCPVREQCLTTTLDAEGGTSARMRFGIVAALNGAERYELATANRVSKPPGRTGRPPAECGTEPAYQRHLKKNEPVDEACRAAHNAHAAKYRSRARR